MPPHTSNKPYRGSPSRRRTLQAAEAASMWQHSCGIIFLIQQPLLQAQHLYVDKVVPLHCQNQHVLLAAWSMPRPPERHMMPENYHPRQICSQVLTGSDEVWEVPGGQGEAGVEVRVPGLQSPQGPHRGVGAQVPLVRCSSQSTLSRLPPWYLSSTDADFAIHR